MDLGHNSVAKAKEVRKTPTLPGVLLLPGQEASKANLEEVFALLAENGKVGSNHIVDALQLLGVWRPNGTWVLEIIDEHFQGCMQLDHAGFMYLHERYQARYYDYMKDAFRKADTNSAGSVSLGDLTSFFLAGDVTPMPGMLRELVAELFDSQTLDFQQFVQLYEAVHTRAGFKRADVEALCSTFARFDQDGDGQLSEEEVLASLRWQDFSVDPRRVRDLRLELRAEAAGPECQGLSSLQEYLLLMHKLRMHELAEVHGAFSTWDRNADGLVSVEDLPSVFEELGYTYAAPQAIQESLLLCMPQAGSPYRQLDQGRTWRRTANVLHFTLFLADQGPSSATGTAAGVLKSSLHRMPAAAPMPASASMMRSPPRRSKRRVGPVRILVEDLHMLLERFRGSNGLLASEHSEIAEAFKLHAASGSDGLSMVELGNAIRWLGYPMTLDKLQARLAAAEWVPPGGAYRHRDERELRRLVAETWRQEVSRLHQRLRNRPPTRCQCRSAFADDEVAVCRRCGEERPLSRTVPVAELGTLLIELGYAPSLEENAALAEDAGGLQARILLWEAVALVEQHRKRARAASRGRGGFGGKEILRLEHRFRQHDPRGTGAIPWHSFGGLFRELFAGKVPPGLLEEISTELTARPGGQDGRLDWAGFLREMRLGVNRISEEKLAREQRAIESTGFTASEVAEFHQIFRKSDADASGDISFREIVGVMSSIVTITQSVRDDLLALVREIDACGSRTLDFGAFLILMKRVLLENWQGVNEAAATLVGKVGNGQDEDEPSDDEDDPGSLSEIASVSLRTPRFM